MAEYIERDAAYDTLTEYYHHKTDIQHKALIQALGRVPDADVAPVRHGRWILLCEEDMKQEAFGFLYSGAGWMNYKCSNCGKLVHNTLQGTEENRTRYCPSCGAKMEVQDDN